MQLLTFLGLLVPPAQFSRAVYVPDSNSNPAWLALNVNDPEPSGGPDWTDDGAGHAQWWLDFQATLGSGAIAWWGGGTYWINGETVTLAAQYHVVSGDADVDGLPDDLDPYPNDSNNNTFYWAGGTFLIGGSSVAFSVQYCAGLPFDNDGDGIPDAVDPYLNDPYNGNPVYWWGGGSFTIDNAPVTFQPGYYYGNGADSDGDGIPDGADPYSTDASNHNSAPTSFSWGGGTFLIDGAWATLPGGTFTGSWSDFDGDSIPDQADPYYYDSANNTAWWSGGTFMIDGQSVTATGQYHRADAGDLDTDGLPDDLDPYLNDPTNRSFWWNGGTFYVDGQALTFYAQYYMGTAADQDGDGLPDVLDPYLLDSANNTSWWEGGTFLLDGQYSFYYGQYYAGLPIDSDGDGIPSILDPYPNDAWNNTSFTWEGKYDFVDGLSVYIPGGTYGGFWSDLDQDGIPDVADTYPNDPINNTGWWPGGTYMIDGLSVSVNGNYCRANAGDTDGDGIPNDLDPYAWDASNNTASWNGGVFRIDGQEVTLTGGYYAANTGDSDFDGIPDPFDLYAHDDSNNSTRWSGGTFTIDGQSRDFPAQWISASAGDSDQDGLPDGVDPYPNDATNTHTYTWEGGSFYIDGSQVTYSGGTYGGFWNDADGDNLPDGVDPYPGDPANNSANWAGGTFLINGQSQVFAPRMHRADAGDYDSDGLPDDIDPAPEDPWNGTSYDFPPDGDVTYMIDDQPMTFTRQTYGGLRVDSDGDGIPDGQDPYPTDETNRNDTDHDGIPDRFENQYGLDLTNPADAQWVREDGLTHRQAYLEGMPFDGTLMDPALDSDGDSMTDIYEIVNGLHRHNQMDAVAAPMNDLVFNFEKARAGMSAATVITDADQYLSLTGHSTTWLSVDPSKSVAENDWDNDGVSNVDEVLVFGTDARDAMSRSSLETIRQALLEEKGSLTTRTNYHWLLVCGCGHVLCPGLGCGGSIDPSMCSCAPPPCTCGTDGCTCPNTTTCTGNCRTDENQSNNSHDNDPPTPCSCSYAGTSDCTCAKAGACQDDCGPCKCGRELCDCALPYHCPADDLCHKCECSRVGIDCDCPDDQTCADDCGRCDCPAAGVYCMCSKKSDCGGGLSCFPPPCPCGCDLYDCNCGLPMGSFGPDQCSCGCGKTCCACDRTPGICITVTYSEFAPNSGFDGESSPHWLMVPSDGINQVHVSINKGAASSTAVHFAVTSSGSVAPESVDGTEENLSVQSTTVGNSAKIEARVLGVELKNSDLPISVKKRKYVTVRLHKVTYKYTTAKTLANGVGDPNQVCVRAKGAILGTSPKVDDVASGLTILAGTNGICDTKADPEYEEQVIPVGMGIHKEVSPQKCPSASDLKQYLDKVYGLQANTYFTVVDAPLILMDADLNVDGILNDSGTATPSPEEKLLHAHGGQGGYDLYFVAEFDGISGVGQAPWKGRYAYVNDRAVSPLRTSAHEIGHCLGLGHSYESKFPDKVTPNPAWLGPHRDGENRIMYMQQPDKAPILLIKPEWDIINNDGE